MSIATEGTSAADQAPVTIRPATMEDLAEVCRLAEYLAASHHEAWPRVFAPAGDPLRDEAYWRDNLAGNSRQAFLAISAPASRVVGFVTVSVGEDNVSLLQPMLTARVGSICVEPDVRGRGVARALMAAARGWAREHGAAEVRLMVWAFNTDALRLYRSLGYEVRAHALALPLDNAGRPEQQKP